MHVQADIVVLATGYINTEQLLLPEQLRKLAGYDDQGQQWLYRSVQGSGKKLRLSFNSPWCRRRHTMRASTSSNLAPPGNFQ